MIFWCTSVSPIPSTCATSSSIHFTSREEVVHLETSLVFEHKFSRSLPCFPSHNGLWADGMDRWKKPPAGGFFHSAIG